MESFHFMHTNSCLPNHLSYRVLLILNEPVPLFGQRPENSTTEIVENLECVEHKRRLAEGIKLK